MAEYESEPKASFDAIRPILIIDTATFRRNSIFLEHFFVALADESIHAAIVCPSECDTRMILSPAIKVITHPACRIPLFWRYNRDRLMEQIEKFAPSVLHCIGREYLALSRKIARQFAVPYLITARGMDTFPRADITNPLCAGFIVPCASVRAYIAGEYPAFASRIEQIEMGAFVEDSCACFAKPQRVPSMVVVRPLDTAKEFEPLLYAVKHLAVERGEFVMAIIGSGKGEFAVRKMVREMGLSQIVTIVPDFNPLRALFSESDIFIQPRPTNAFSVPLLEAMSVGMAVAGCKGGVDDLLIKDRTAVLFDPDDHLSIYATLGQLLDDRIGAQQLACGAQSYLRQHHRVSKMMSGLIEAYGRVALKGGLADSK
ncbi:MAG: glycosyltransferase family 4 protein [Sedimentisphaerales bacterium]|nr:glycosyltransferase family 4 protein [Sedimentisphaerales bacterium]